MAWTTPQYSRREVDKAAAILGAPRGTSSEKALDWAFEVIDNWRSSHSFPLNTFQMGLRGKAKQVESAPLVAQRIKRLSSIFIKLLRFKWLTLSEMQDIGGCRTVISSVRHVDRLVLLYKDSDIKHGLIDEDDYIRNPKRSGYRGRHLVYRYHSDRNDTYNGLKIEMQLRSQLQHAWATAVETVGLFIRQALKSSQGEKDWLRFFSLMGSAIARRERTRLVPDTPTRKKELVDELREHTRRLDVEARLRAYKNVLRSIEEPSARNAHYFLLELDIAANRVTVKGYGFKQFEQASSDYSAIERRIYEKPGTVDAVLVSVESLKSLRRAYPNYFLDTDVFLDAVRKAIA